MTSQGPSTRRLTTDRAREQGDEHISHLGNKSQFMFDLNEDAMATEKFSEGIRKFSADITPLSKLMEAKIVQ